MVNVLFSVMIDVSMAILGVLHPDHAVGAVPVHRLRLRGVGLGIVIELAPNVVVVPAKAWSVPSLRVSGVRVGTVKAVFDITADHHRRGAVIDLLPRVARRRHRHGDFRGVGRANHQHRQSRLHLPAPHSGAGLVPRRALTPDCLVTTGPGMVTRNRSSELSMRTGSRVSFLSVAPMRRYPVPSSRSTVPPSGYGVTAAVRTGMRCAWTLTPHG